MTAVHSDPRPGDGESA